jgi:hypothetical protein
MKAVYKSKTVWLNVLTMLVALLTMLQDNPLIPPVAQPYVLLAGGVLNLVLRIWFTDEPIG